MPDEQEIAKYADPQRGQYFLVSREKLAMIIGAAGIRPADHVVEVGAGVGTVARAIPPSASLTVVEIDGRLIDLLRRNAPTNARVVQGDGIELLRGIRFDVLIANLPHAVTELLIDVLPQLAFRVAVLAVGESTDLDRLGRDFSWSEVTSITGDDFRPPQSSVSRIVRVVRRTGEPGVSAEPMDQSM